jgi:hypothetical protein
MSTVLWANYLADGLVTSDESDKYALFKHLDKLDKLCKAKGLALLSDLCDSTDLRFNLEEFELPDGMESTNEAMALEGVWVDGAEALTLLEQLLEVIRTDKTKFGLIKDNHNDVVAELDESIAFAKIAADKKAKFNFCFVM